MRSVENNLPDGFWVYIGEFKDPVEQRMALARLNAAGIHDAAPLTQSDQSDRISVGIFNDQSHAVRRAEQVRQLGFKPVLDIHQHAANEHWIDVQLKPTESDPPPSQFQGGAAAGATEASSALEVVDCPAKKAASG